MSRNYTILVIDDNRTLADGFARALDEEYEVYTAYSAAEARESFDPKIDAVLLDRRLPDGSGDELLEEIRERGYGYGVVVVSAENPSSDLDCDAYLTKPVGGVESLRRTVADLFDGSVSG